MLIFIFYSFIWLIFMYLMSGTQNDFSPGFCPFIWKLIYFLLFCNLLHVHICTIYYCFSSSIFFLLCQTQSISLSILFDFLFPFYKWTENIYVFVLICMIFYRIKYLLNASQSIGYGFFSSLICSFCVSFLDLFYFQLHTIFTYLVPVSPHYTELFVFFSSDVFCSNFNSKQHSEIHYNTTTT